MSKSELTSALYYGTSLTIDQMDDDEGGAMDLYADERMSTVELCLLACRAPGASERDDFVDLVREICTTKDERVSNLSFGDAEAVALIRDLEQQGHPQAAALREHARRCFPYGAWR